MELLQRAREAAVAAQIDLAGPPLTVLPAGRTSADLSRFDFGSDGLSGDAVERLTRDVSSLVRAVDPRLVGHVAIAGEPTAVVGVDPARVVSPHAILGGLAPDEVAVGALVAAQRRTALGDAMAVAGGTLRVVAVLPTVGRSEDLAVYLHLDTARRLLDTEQVANAVGIFPRAGVAPLVIASEIRRSEPALALAMEDRGSVAEAELGDVLARYRGTFYAIASLVVAIAILVWSFLDAAERRLELATLVALGTSWTTLLALLSLRAATAATLGGVAGYAFGALVALSWDAAVAAPIVWDPVLALTVSAGSAALGVLGALPASVAAAGADHVRALQTT
jgi:hypothetical protein